MASVGRLVVAINCGSSSLKFGLYSTGDEGLRLQSEGEGEGIGSDHSKFWFQPAGQEKQEEKIGLRDHRVAVEHAWKLMGADKTAPAAIGHRIVHGGPKVTGHEVISASLLKDLEEAASFAPLHVPPALKAIEAIGQKTTNALQVACLDDAFHSQMPDVSKCFALPPKIREMGVKRYGFHGLSLESILSQLEPIPARLIVAHLGGGCSVTAIKEGRSVDTTMGLTPTGGMMMGTRCGDLDPGVVLYLMRNGFADADKLEKIFDHESGLLGVSGVSSDLREIEKALQTNSEADLARRLFVHQLVKSIVSMAASCGGVDTLVFTGGIGENNRPLREEASRQLSFLGKFEAIVLPSKEDLQIATITSRLAFESN